jgi:16S rRNA (guanine527-N7)-methyltransferase
LIQDLLNGLAALRGSIGESAGWRPQTEDSEAAATLAGYLQELQRWNRAFNLTAVRDPSHMVVRHVLDSLSIAPWVHGKALDAGTGAGLPAIPLAIMNPALKVTALDSSGKKIRFVRHIVRELRLQNVEPVEQRLESHNPGFTYDVIMSRAFSSLADFALSARHLLGRGARLLAMKAEYPQSELAGLPDGIKVDSIESLTVPGLHADRHLVIMSLS